MAGSRKQKWGCRAQRTLCCTALAATATIVMAVLSWEPLKNSAHGHGWGANLPVEHLPPPTPEQPAVLGAPFVAAASGSRGATKHRIFTFWDYPNGPSPWVTLNVETWLASAPPGTEVVRVNDSNFRSLVPDAPEEWFHMPYAACKSDIVRAAVLYHQGGLYMDTDFLALGSLGSVFAKLDEGWDIVAYSDEESSGRDARSGPCKLNVQFSSNFMAARKGNSFSRTWWTNMKAKLTRVCGEGEYDLEKVCCHEAFAKEPERRPCHIPWAHLEWLKNPREDPDAKGPPGVSPGAARRSPQARSGPEAEAVLAAVKRGNAPALPLPKDAKMFCLMGPDAVAPHLNGEVYWQPWDATGGATLPGSRDKGRYDLRFSCRESSAGDLHCEKGNWGDSTRVHRRFFQRVAYHLFFSTRRVSVRSREEALQADWLVSELYRRALAPRPLPPEAAAAAPAPLPAPLAGGAVAGAGQAPAPVGAAGSSGPQLAKRRIFTLWEYPDGASPLVHLNVESWRKHAPEGTEVVLVNNSNFKSLVPDTPEEWFRLPYAACKADVVKAAVLFHQGGLYMDTDFVVMGPLEGIFARLEGEADLVVHRDGEDGQSGPCSLAEGFSSGFLGARRGNDFSRTWWENIKKKLTRTCAPGEFQQEKVCCNEAFGPKPEKRPCHVPWLHLEMLKNPASDADASRTPAPSQGQADAAAAKELAAIHRGNEPALRVPGGVKGYCLTGLDGVAPYPTGEVYWQPWDGQARATKPGRADEQTYDLRFKCQAQGEDLVCEKGNWGDQPRVTKRFFARTAYHLLFSFRQVSVKTREAALESDWLLGHLYRRSLGLPEPAAPATPPPVNAQPAAGTTPTKYNIYTYWDYPNGPSPLVRLNIDSWLAHAPSGTELVRVNDSNIKKLVPDVPKEWFRLPYAACKSDVVRASVLFHQGGLYMDTDFLVLESLSAIFSRLDAGWDVVAYSDESAGGESGQCELRKSFSSNFMAARKGNPFSRTWWENVKHKLTRTCAEGEFELEKVCCHEAFGKEPEKRPCHIPWAFLEWLKVPQDDPDSRGPPGEAPDRKRRKLPTREGPEAEEAMAKIAQGNTPALRVPKDAKLYCLRGPDGVAPHLNGEVFWQPWDPATGTTLSSGKLDSGRYDLRFKCRIKGKDLKCDAGNWGKNSRSIKRFFGRTAFHLFFSTRKMDVKSPEDALRGDWMLSELYRRSFSSPSAAETRWRSLAQQLLREAAATTTAAPALPAPPAPPAAEALPVPAVSSKAVQYNIFTYWDYPNGPPPFVQLNVDTWMAHAPPGSKLLRVNDSNFRSLVPDAPEEWFRLPYAACKSDVVRAAVLFHQGGLYMDTDFLVLEPLSTVFKRLEDGWDVVTYSDETEKGQSGECDFKRRFSSNFMAARPGNPFSRTWWANIKAKLTRTCGEGEFELEKVCCHEAYSPKPEKRPCHIPWAYLEWLKNPENDPDRKGKPRLTPGSKRKEVQDRSGPEAEKVLAEIARGNAPALRVPPEARIYCLRGPDGVAPHINGEVYWQPWDVGPQASLPGKTDSQRYDLRFDCRETGDRDLQCEAGNWGKNTRVHPRFFGRTAYHIFFSTRRVDVDSPESVLEGDWLLSELYRRSFAAPGVTSRWREHVLGLRSASAIVGELTAAIDASAAQPQAAPSKYNIYTYWDYKNGIPPFVQLNVDTWLAHAPPGTELVRVNDTNFKSLVPDAPEEWFRLPYAACKSDVVRAAVLYHQGGLYMDTDFLVLGPLSTVFAKLDAGHDIVAYSDESESGESGTCELHRKFSSNFMAARKGNPFSRTWWTNVRAKLTRTCAEGEFDVEKVCCHEAFAKEPERRPCHIPWAFLEWLKNPGDDPDAKGPPGKTPGAKKRKVPKRTGPEADAAQAEVEKGNARAVRIPREARLYCLRGPDGVAPHLNGEVYWQPWNVEASSTLPGKKDGSQYDLRFKCQEKAGGDLHCEKGNWGKQTRVHRRFFGRTAFHIFFSTRRVHVGSPQEALQGDWLLSELYRRSFSAPDATDTRWRQLINRR